MIEKPLKSKNSADYWIEKLGLTPHPEGGYYKEVYRSEIQISEHGLPSRYSGSRKAVTSIYFLLKSDDISKFHKLKSDESWHFYTGSPLTIHQIDKAGTYSKIRLGSDLEKDMTFQYTIENGNWFGATVDNPESFTLVGCTVAPGFDFNDFQLADAKVLVVKFPQHKDIIEKLT